MRTIEVFLRQLIDYAGMFPPAQLSFDEALANYHQYESSRHIGFLGAFVAPVAALKDAGDLPDEVTAIARSADALLYGLPHLKAYSVEAEYNGEPGLLNILEDSVPGRVFVELDWRKPYAALMDTIEARGDRFALKLRTGGVTPEAIPPPGAIADFLLAAAERRLPLKATAGLHVPIPNHDPDVGTRLHGFLNFFAAGFLAYTGRGDREMLIDVLDDFDYADFEFGADSMRCGEVEYTRDEVARLREESLLSFGSCSFLDPIRHMEQHGLL